MQRPHDIVMHTSVCGDVTENGLILKDAPFISWRQGSDRVGLAIGGQDRAQPMNESGHQAYLYVRVQQFAASRQALAVHFAGVPAWRQKIEI
jgi:hypothetical protein